MPTKKRKSPKKVLSEASPTTPPKLLRVAFHRPKRTEDTFLDSLHGTPNVNFEYGDSYYIGGYLDVIFQVVRAGCGYHMQCLGIVPDKKEPQFIAEMRNDQKWYHSRSWDDKNGWEQIRID